MLMPLFCNAIDVDRKDLCQSKGPLLIASNHPNSFLDAIIFDILFDLPVTALARGDAFQNKRIFGILRRLKMLPVYRIREGAENLNSNYDTFNTCIHLLRKNEAVLIFSEGLCVNEWHLRPLKKGTARLAAQAWDAGIDLKVLPAGINYSSFRKPGKKIIIHLGEALEAGDFDRRGSDGVRHLAFNRELYTRLRPLVYEIEAADTRELTKKFGKTTFRQRLLLGPLAFLGGILHVPFYAFAWLVARGFNKAKVHFDSLMFVTFIMGYPFYLLLAGWLLFVCTSACLSLSLVWLLPLTLACYMKYDVRKG